MVDLAWYRCRWLPAWCPCARRLLTPLYCTIYLHLSDTSWKAAGDFNARFPPLLASSQLEFFYPAFRMSDDEITLVMTVRTLPLWIKYHHACNKYSSRYYFSTFKASVLPHPHWKIFLFFKDVKIKKIDLPSIVVDKGRPFRGLKGYYSLL